MEKTRKITILVPCQLISPEKINEIMNMHDNTSSLSSNLKPNYIWLEITSNLLAGEKAWEKERKRTIAHFSNFFDIKFSD